MKNFYFFTFFLLIFFPSDVHSQEKKTVDSISNLSLPYIQSNLSKVIPVLKKNVEDAKKTNNPKAEAKTSGLLSLAYYYSGDYDENMKYAFRAIAFFQKLNDYENLANLYGEVGFRIKATNLKEAEKFMMKGLKISEKSGYTKPLLGIYNNYGVVKDMMKQPDSALFYFNKGLQLKRKLKDSVGIPYSLNNIGEAYLKKEQFNLAEKYFDEAMAYRVALKDQYGIADNYAYSGDLYFAMKKYSLAIEHFEKSVQISEKLKISNLLRHDYNMLSQAYEFNQNLPKALEYYKKNQVLKDSIINKETYDKMAELQVKYDTAEKEKQILEAQTIQKKRLNTIKILLILFISALLISYLIYRSLKLKNQNQKKEFELKSAIEGIKHQNKLQDQRLEISRDLHDNIGAQLTFIISSVETLKDTFSIQDEKINARLNTISAFAKETIVELRDTIWAMNHSEITFEEMKSRILNFVDKARQSNETIDFEFQVDESLNDFKFNSTEGMHVYRIIQEAVNNSMKYSGANRILINISDADSSIKIVLKDNGKGFDETNSVAGNGLRNMKKRAAAIGSAFEIQSGKALGTEISFTLDKKLPKENQR